MTPIPRMPSGFGMGAMSFVRVVMLDRDGKEIGYMTARVASWEVEQRAAERSFYGDVSAVALGGMEATLRLGNVEVFSGPAAAVPPKGVLPLPIERVRRLMLGDDDL